MDFGAGTDNREARRRQTRRINNYRSVEDAVAICGSFSPISQLFQDCLKKKNNNPALHHVL